MASGKAGTDAEKAPAAGADAKQNKALLAAILSFFIPGAGQFYIGSRRAMMYLAIFFLLLFCFIVLCVLIFAGYVFINQLCIIGALVPAGLLVLSLAYHIASAVDAYREATGKEDARLLKFLIK